MAPNNGIATFNTDDSAFDTLLSAYYFSSTTDTTFDKLLVAMRADDSEGRGQRTQIQFGVLAGQRYEIAVDGYFGATGALRLQWSFQRTRVPPPIVLRMPGDRAVKLGDPVTLTVELNNV